MDQMFWQELLQLSAPMAYLLAAVIFGGSLALGLLARKVIFPHAMRLAQRLRQNTLGVVLEAFRRPVVYIVLLCGTLLSLAVFPMPVLKTPQLLLLQKRLGNIGFIVLFAWGLCGVCALIPQLVDSLRGKLELSSGRTFAKFLKGICQGVVVLVAAVMILSELGYDVNGLLAGLGLGGLTVALAAKDIASNLFAGFTIITEHPFDIGDWIQGAGLEGTVEDITLRSTKLRTLNNALTIVPNSQLCAVPITNWTRMQMRFAQFTLGIEYGTPRATLEQLLSELRAMLERDEDVRTETVHVRVSEFGESAIHIAVQFNTFTTDLFAFRAVREHVYLQIMTLMEQVNVAFAFPSRTLYWRDENNFVEKSNCKKAEKKPNNDIN